MRENWLPRAETGRLRRGVQGRPDQGPHRGQRQEREGGSLPGIRHRNTEMDCAKNGHLHVIKKDRLTIAQS